MLLTDVAAWSQEKKVGEEEGVGKGCGWGEEEAAAAAAAAAGELSEE